MDKESGDQEIRISEGKMMEKRLIGLGMLLFVVFLAGCGQVETASTTSTTVITTTTSSITTTTHQSTTTIVTTTTTITTTTSTVTTTTTTSTTTTTINGGSEYFPHNNGYIWTYNYLISGGVGTQIMSIEGTHNIGTLETQVFKYLIINPSGPSVSTGEMYYVINDEAALFYGIPGIATTEGEPYLSFPLYVGKSWSFQSLNILKHCLVVSRETVVVPAGSFENCYKIYTTHESGSAVNVYEWFAPNVGNIKTNNISISTGNIVSTCELTSKNF